MVFREGVPESFDSQQEGGELNVGEIVQEPQNPESAAAILASGDQEAIIGPDGKYSADRSSERLSDTEKCRMRGRELGLRDFVGGTWLTYDPRQEGFSPKDLLEQVGQYDTNNGKIAFVDDEGGLYFESWTTSREDALKDAGFKRGSVFVPFSNGEERSAY